MTRQKLDTTETEGTPAGKTFGEPLRRTLLGPLLIFGGLLAITLYAAFYQRFEERDEALHAGEVARTLVCCRAERLTEDTLRPLRGVSLEVIDHGPPDQAAFTAAIAPIVQLEPSYRSLALVDPENRVTACWIRPGVTGSPPVISQDLASRSPAWRDALARARGSGEIIAAEPVEHDQPDSLDFVVPIRRDADNLYQGSIVGTLSIAELLHDLFDPRVATQFNVTLIDAQNHVRGGQGNPPARWTAGVGASEPVKMLDSTWNLRVVPAVSYDRGLPIKEPVWIFIVGLVI
jgi:sensor domain CHASE-containing protein